MSKINWKTQESAKNYEQNSDHQFLKGKMLVEMMNISMKISSK
jgi:hypothetical protein